jgi:translation initiation factor IF-2
LEGTLKKGTPLVAVAEKPIPIGIVETIRKDNKDTDNVGPGGEVSVQISTSEGVLQVGKDIRPDAELVSRMSRHSIDVLKNHFRDDVKPDEWRLIIEIKKILAIQ